MVPSHSLIPWPNLRQIIYFLFLCIENPPILTSTCSGIVITICLPSSVIGTLTHREKQFAQDWSTFNKEIQHHREALSRCKYHKWALDKVQSMFIASNWENGNIQQDNTNKGDTSADSNTKEGPPQGQTQCRSHCYPIHSRVSGKY